MENENENENNDSQREAIIPDYILYANDVATILGLKDRRTLVKLIKDGLPMIRLGNRLIIESDTFKEYLAIKCKETNPDIFQSEFAESGGFVENIKDAVRNELDMHDNPPTEYGDNDDGFGGNTDEDSYGEKDAGKDAGGTRTPFVLNEQDALQPEPTYDDRPLDTAPEPVESQHSPENAPAVSEAAQRKIEAENKSQQFIAGLETRARAKAEIDKVMQSKPQPVYVAPQPRIEQPPLVGDTSRCKYNGQPARDDKGNIYMSGGCNLPDDVITDNKNGTYSVQSKSQGFVRLIYRTGGEIIYKAKGYDYKGNKINEKT